MANAKEKKVIKRDNMYRKEHHFRKLAQLKLHTYKKNDI